MALSSIDWNRACPALAVLLLGTLRIEDPHLGGCRLNLLHSPWSKAHDSLPQGTQLYMRELMGQESHHRWGKVLFNSAVLLEWPGAACKPDGPAHVRGRRTGQPVSCSCPSPTCPAAAPTTTQKTPSSCSAPELRLDQCPPLLTVLLFSAPPWALEELARNSWSD